MSSPHHIPFPRAFLSLNTVSQKNVKPTDPVVMAAAEPDVSAHAFLSNRPAAIPRHASVSSVGSVESVTSTASAPVNEAPSPKPALVQFLSLNTKYAAPPASAKEMSEAEKHGFLSNRH